jgi:hypothetical protein
LSAAAAILSEEAEERIHLVELGGVDHRPAFAAHGYKPGRPEPIKVKSQGIRGEVEGGSDGPRWHALGAGLHKEAEYIKSTVLSEGGQRRDDIRLFHISANIEMTSSRQALFRCLLKCYSAVSTTRPAQVICPSGGLLTGVSSLISGFPKNISVPTYPKSILEFLPSHPTRGAYHDRHGRGEGCGGRGSVLRATGLQGGLAKGL